MKQQESIYPSQFLSGWKEIANYLGLGVRTVQRYEIQLGLPVRRTSNRPRTKVIATKEELDGWIHARPLAHQFALRHVSLDVATLKAFRKSLAEQRELREELKKMREDLRTSLTRIEASVGVINGTHKGLIQDHNGLPLPSKNEYQKPN